MPVVGTHSLFSADEGAAIAQAHLLADGHGWTMAHPFPAADPSGDAFPIELSRRRGDRYAPFVQHPLYPVLLAGADKVGGRSAMVLLSVAGTWVAAVFGALTAACLDRRRSVAILTLWLVGLVSPLLFDGYVLIAHAVAAACAAVAAMMLVRVLDRRLSVAVGGPIIAVAVFAAVQLRTEALLLAAGLAAAAGVVAWRRREQSLAILAAIPLVAALVTNAVQGRWTAAIMGGASVDTEPVGAATRGGLVDHLRAFVITVVLPSYRADAAAVLTMATAVLIVVATVVIVRQPEDAQGPIVLLGAAAVSGVARLFLAADPVSGLLIACPLLLVALVSARRDALVRDDRVVALVVAAAVFAVGVLATQYSEGGSGEWGGRYFAIGLPVILPVVAVVLVGLPQRIVAANPRVVIALLAIAVLVFPIVSVRTLRSYHHSGDDLVDAVVATAAATPPGDGGPPVVLSTDGTTARYAVDHLAEGRWLTLKIESVAPYAERLRGLSVQAFTLITHHHEDFARVPGYRLASESEPVGGWLVGVLRAG